MEFADDIDAAALAGWGPGRFDEYTRSGFAPGDLARRPKVVVGDEFPKVRDFLSFDEMTRRIVMAILAGYSDVVYPPSGLTFQEMLDEHLDARSIAEWLLTLPAFQGDSDAEPIGASDPGDELALMRGSSRR